MKAKKLLTIIMLMSSMNLFAEENMSVDTPKANKGICQNLCNYACTTDYCVEINGEQVCKESCSTVCEYLCE